LLTERGSQSIQHERLPGDVGGEVNSEIGTLHEHDGEGIVVR
jgi:hypothetical protein